MNDGHRYSFRMPGVPWAKYDELGRKIADKPKKAVAKKRRRRTVKQKHGGRK